MDFPYKSKDLGGHVFEVSMLDPETAMDLEIDLLKTLGPSVAEMAGEGLSEAALTNGLRPALLALIQNMDKATLRSTCKTLEGVTRIASVDGKPSALANVSKLIFLGKTKLRWQWLLFALEVQFSDFFEGAGDIRTLLTDLFEEMKQKAPSESPAD